MIYSNGDEYVGDWKDDFQDGKGIYTWPHGVKYVGDFKGSNRHG